MLYIGVDLGTSAVKLLVMDETGDIKKIVSKDIRSSSHIRDGQSRNRKTGLKNQWKGSKN